MGLETWNPKTNEWSKTSMKDYLGQLKKASKDWNKCPKCDEKTLSSTDGGQTYHCSSCGNSFASRSAGT